jgi:hypothetical protein
MLDGLRSLRVSIFAINFLLTVVKATVKNDSRIWLKSIDENRLIPRIFGNLSKFRKKDADLIPLEADETV